MCGNGGKGAFGMLGKLPVFGAPANGGMRGNGGKGPFGMGGKPLGSGGSVQGLKVWDVGHFDPEWECCLCLCESECCLCRRLRAASPTSMPENAKAMQQATMKNFLKEAMLLLHIELIDVEAKRYLLCLK